MRFRQLAFFLSFLLLAVSAQAAQVNKIAAVVNGQVITMFDLQREAIPEFMRARVDPADPSKKAQTDQILKNTLDTMILDILVAQEAKRLKVSVGNSEVDSEITRIMESRNMTRKQFEAQLAQQKIPIETLRKNLEKNLLRQKIMSMEVGRKVVVTPQEIAEYYEAHRGELFKRDGLHMALLVYSPKANAAAIASQIKSGKLSFADACAKYSIATNREKGGDQGPVEWDKLNPEWSGRLSRMKPGDVTDIFTIQGHKAQIHLFRPGGGAEQPLTLQEATPQIDSILRMPKARERFGDYSRQLRERAVIDVRI